MSKKIMDRRLWVFVAFTFSSTMAQQLALLSTVGKISGIMWALAFSTCVSATAGAVWAYWTEAPISKKSTAETQRTQRPESGSSGRVVFPLVFLCGLCASAVMLLCLPACVTSTAGAIEAVQDFNDDLADRVGIDQKYVDAARVRVAKSEAARAGLKVVPTNAVILPASAKPFAKELREIGTDRVIESGVYERQVFEVRTIIAEPTAPAKAPEPQSNVSPNPSGGAVVQPPPPLPGPHPADAVPPSSALLEVQSFSVQAHATRAAGAIAESITGATVVASIDVSGVSGWSTNGGAVTLSGKVQSLEGVPPGIDAASLVFSNLAGVVTAGVLAASSPAGAEMAFNVSARLADGSFSGSAVPRVGTAAAAFLQSLEVAGVALVTGSAIVTNKGTAEAQNTQSVAAVQSLDAIPADKITIIGKHKMSPAKATPSARLHSAKIEGGNVRISFDPLGWPSESSKGKTVDGGVIIVWPDGKGGFVGGWFDHHGQGQKVKTLSNIFGGYVAGQKPPPGPVWFYLISYSGRERSNIVRSSNDWK